MRVTVYDRNPGPGFRQWFLKTTWLLGCWFQKLVGAVDAYYGADGWDDARTWLLQQPGPLKVVQYWGHGSPGTIWLAGEPTHAAEWLALQQKMATDSLLWFRVCSAFQGEAGYAFSRELADGLNCIIAGHTRIIGVFQGGLHTRRSFELPSWKVTDGEFPKGFWAGNGLRWGNNTIICLATKIPKGW